MKKILNIIFLIIPFLSFIVLFNTWTYSIFWEFAYKVLILIMFIRPLRDIFPKKLKFLNKIIVFRKELWIIVWSFGIAHSVWYFLDTKTWFDLILNPNIWALDSFLAWWIIAFFVSIPLLLTSNKFSMIKMWKYWKKLQYLAYVMFISVVFHVSFVKDEFYIWIFIIFMYLFVLFLSAFLRKKRLKNIK